MLVDYSISMRWSSLRGEQVVHHLSSVIGLSAIVGLLVLVVNTRSPVGLLIWLFLLALYVCLERE